MLLRIHRNEAIRSYVERNIFICGNGKFPKWYTSKRLTTEDIRSVASLLGWHGCSGFNRILHSHTYQPLHSVFKNSQDMANSGSKYIAEFADYEPALQKPLTFCPECLKTDFATIGFSYWRRDPLESLTVCAIHNVILESVCPICDRPFTSQEHGRNVMWEGCGACRHRQLWVEICPSDGSWTCSRLGRQAVKRQCRRKSRVVGHGHLNVH
jgi:hypothetical protein